MEETLSYALDELYDEIANAEDGMDYQLTFSKAEFGAVLACLDWCRQGIAGMTEDQRSALNYLQQMLAEAQQLTDLETQEKGQLRLKA